MSDTETERQVDLSADQQRAHCSTSMLAKGSPNSSPRSPDRDKELWETSLTTKKMNRGLTRDFCRFSDVRELLELGETSCTVIGIDACV